MQQPPVVRDRRVLIAALVALHAAGVACAQESFRAVWADAFSVGFKSNSQINSMVGRAVTGNYNAIIMEVLAYHDTGVSAHGAYWNSNIVPKAADISGNIDPLATAVSVAHANGIEVHAWIVPYRVSTSWPPNGNAFLAAHPEYLMVSSGDLGGGPAKVNGVYVLDPGSPEAQEYLVSIVQELVTNYEIDGINLDYIRYTTTDAGYPADISYPNSTLARFQDLTGFPGVPAPTGEPSWNDFRRQTIDEYVRRLRAEIASVTSNPQQPLRFTADLITFGDAPPGLNFTQTSAWTLHQNWKMWMERGWLDAGVPMNYKREHVGSERQWYRNWVTAMLAWRANRQIFGGQATYLNTKSNSVTQLSYALNQGVDGTVTFSYDATADENTDGIPETDWNWYSFASNNLFDTSVPTPAMPWRDPNTATEGTLWGRVTDQVSGDPIDGATVQVGSLDAVQTDGNGYYVVTLVPAAAGGTAYSVTAMAGGCPDASVSATVQPGEVARRDIEVCPLEIQIGDMDEDGDVDFDDLNLFLFCMRGPASVYSPTHFCLNGDDDGDRDMDMADMAHFQVVFGQ